MVKAIDPVGGKPKKQGGEGSIEEFDEYLGEEVGERKVFLRRGLLIVYFAIHRD
jgi:hypothetical protein